MVIRIYMGYDYLSKKGSKDGEIKRFHVGLNKVTLHIFLLNIFYSSMVLQIKLNQYGFHQAKILSVYLLLDIFRVQTPGNIDQVILIILIRSNQPKMRSNKIK